VPFPSLFDEPDEPILADDPLVAEGLLGEGLYAGRRSREHGRERRLVLAATASGTIHALALVVAVVLLTEAIPPPVPPEKPVSMTFVQPRPLVAPPPARRHASAPSPPPTQSSQALPAPPPSMKAPIFKPQLTPPEPLPQPNRMGDQPPVPPPPKRTRETPPPPTESVPDTADERGAKPRAPAQAGVPDGVGQALPEGPAGVGAENSGGSGSPALGQRAGSFPVPGAPGAPGLSQPGPGGEGSRFPGSGAKPPRRGIKLGVPFDTGIYQNFTPEHQDFDWTDYWPQMYYAILRAWYNRLLATSASFERAAYERGSDGLEGQVVLQFTIERSGNISRAVVLTPSAIVPLDDSARDALREVILPRLPDNFPYERENVTGTFRMDVNYVRGWCADLSAMKSRRLF